MQTKSNPFLLSLISICLFFVLYLILSFNSRIASDDFFYWGLVQTNGIWASVLYQYNNFCGRWSSLIASCLLLNHADNKFLLPLFYNLNLLLLLFSVYKVLSTISNCFKIEIKKAEILFLSVSLTCSFFFSNFSIGETWFWFSVLTYIWSITAALLMFNVILSRDLSLWQILVVLITAAYIGGAAESYSLIFLLLLSLFIFYKLKHNNYIISKTLKETSVQKALFAFIILSISFSITYFAPGTSIRSSLLPQTTIIEKTWQHVKAYVKLCIIYIPPKLPYLIIFNAPWIIAGNIFIKPKISFSKNQAVKVFKILTLILIASIFIMLLPTSYAMSEIAPDRALSLISLVITVYFALSFSIIGASEIISGKMIFRTYKYISVIGIVVLCYHIITEYSTTTKFSKAFDERIIQLNKLKKSNFTGIAELDKLPPEGMLYWDKVSADTNYYVNQQIKRGLQLQFTIKLKDADTPH